MKELIISILKSSKQLYAPKLTAKVRFIIETGKF